MNLLDLVKRALLAFVVKQKQTDTLPKLHQLLRRERNRTIWKIPKKPNVHLYEGKGRITLVDMPGDTEGRNPGGSLIPVIGITEDTLHKRTIGYREAINMHIIFILDNRANALGSPDIDNSIADHTSIATC